MKVRLIHPISGPDGTYKSGDTPELPEVLAASLIREGHAAPFADEPIAAAAPLQERRPVPARRARRK